MSNDKELVKMENTAHKHLFVCRFLLTPDLSPVHREHMKNEQRLRVALYARVSTKDGRQDKESQLGQLREFCAKQGWHIGTEYVDERSGKNGDRPQFKRMLDAASRREFDVLLFWSLDRLTREGALATLKYLELLTSYGVGYRSFGEAYLDSVGPFRDAVVAILGCIARQERQRISERVLAGLARARKQGRIGGRPKVVVSTTKIRKLAEQGLSGVQIGRQLGCSRMTVARRMEGR
jgi:DNA invertase Pin-like site-specific DNA recombinase